MNIDDPTVCEGGRPARPVIFPQCGAGVVGAIHNDDGSRCRCGPRREPMAPPATHGIPRRIDHTRLTPAERAIFDAVQVVESAGAHPLVTEAVNLLAEAREAVADYVDSGEYPGCTCITDRNDRCAIHGIWPKP